MITMLSCLYGHYRYNRYTSVKSATQSDINGCFLSMSSDTTYNAPLFPASNILLNFLYKEPYFSLLLCTKITAHDYQTSDFSLVLFPGKTEVFWRAISDRKTDRQTDQQTL